MNKLEMMKEMVELQEKHDQIDKFLKGFNSHYTKGGYIKTNVDSSDYNASNIEMKVDKELFIGYLKKEKDGCQMMIDEIFVRLNK